MSFCRLGLVGVLLLGLLTSSFGEDAISSILNKNQNWKQEAYVAERVLTVQELKKFVDQKYPPYVKEGDLFESNEKTHPSSGKELSLRERTRWVRSTLSRRYAREFDFESALAYVADEERKDLDQLSRYWEVGREEKNPLNERATALWNAAQLVARGGDLLFKMEVKIGLLKAGNSVAANLKTGDELTASVGDVEEGLVRGQAEGRRHLEPGEGVVLKATGGRLVRHFVLCGVEAVGMSILSSHGGGGEGREVGLQPSRFGSTQWNSVGVFQSLESL